MKFVYSIGCICAFALVQLQAADFSHTVDIHAPQPKKPVGVKHPTRPDSPYPPSASSSLQVKPLGESTNSLSIIAESIPPVEPIQPHMTRAIRSEPDTDRQELRDFAEFLGQLSLSHGKKSCLEVCDESASSSAVCAYLIGTLIQVLKRTSVELVTATDEKIKEQLAKKIKETTEHIEGVMDIATHTNPVFKHLRNAYHGKRNGIGGHKGFYDKSAAA